MVSSLFKNKASEPKPNNTALSNSVNTQRANLDAVGPVGSHASSTIESPTAKTDVNIGALHQSQPPSIQQPAYKGDPDSEVLVFDLDETTVDTGDKRQIDEELATKLGYKIEHISSDDPKNKFGHDISYAPRLGLEGLFRDLYNDGHKIVLTTRNYEKYMDAIAEHEPIFQKYVVGTLSRPDFESVLNKDFTKFPTHPDKLSLWQKTKSLCSKVFIKTPKYCWHKIKGLFTGKPARWDPGRGTLGKHPPNVIDLLAAKGNHKLKGCKPARFLIDNQATYHTGNPKDSNTYKYYGREFEDSCHSGDFAVISPNVVRDNGHKASSFHADTEEPKADNGEYLWVKNIKDGIKRGWKGQYKLTTGKQVKAK